MSSLVVCPDCARHIRRTEKACPFCGTPVTAKVAQSPERPMPTERLGRYAISVFAAASIGAVACGGSTSTGRDGNKVDGAGGDVGTGGQTQQGGTAGSGGYLDHGNGGAIYGSGGIPDLGTGGKAGSGGTDPDAGGIDAGPRTANR